MGDLTEAEAHLASAAFPAPAGMNRRCSRCRDRRRRVPRARGDEPMVYEPAPKLWLRSPRPRG